MNLAAVTPAPPDLHPTSIERLYQRFFEHSSSTPSTRVMLILGLAVAAHLLVLAVGYTTERIVELSHQRRLRFVAESPKFVTVIRLAANTFVWTIYFIAIGLFLEECGVNLAAYLASASVIGLAVSFGSQGLVQDMVIGLTLIFSDAMDVDDLVEIVGTAVVVGRVQEIGLRFTKVVNLYNQVVFIPNRTVANVSRFPHGGIYAYVDVRLPGGDTREDAERRIRTATGGFWKQFGAIVLAEPEIDPVSVTGEGGWEFLRVRLVIWPGQGTLLETAFRQHLLREMQALDPTYADWQITVLYRASAGRPLHPPAGGTLPLPKA